MQILRLQNFNILYLGKLFIGGFKICLTVLRFLIAIFAGPHLAKQSTKNTISVTLFHPQYNTGCQINFIIYYCKIIEQPFSYLFQTYCNTSKTLFYMRLILLFSLHPLKLYALGACLFGLVRNLVKYILFDMQGMFFIVLWPVQWDFKNIRYNEYPLV